MNANTGNSKVIKTRNYKNGEDVRKIEIIFCGRFTTATEYCTDGS